MRKEVIRVYQHENHTEIRRYDGTSGIETAVVIALILIGAYFWFPLWVL